MKKVKINRGIFSDETIRKTMEIYKDYTVATLKFNTDYAIITFWKCKYDEAQTIMEFENYMIGIENSI